MGKLDQYRASIKQIINRYAAIQPAYGSIESQTTFDTEHDHYQLVHAGWNKKYREYGCLMHIR